MSFHSDQLLLLQIAQVSLSSAARRDDRVSELELAPAAWKTSVRNIGDDLVVGAARLDRVSDLA